jgi:hypothetical protein
MARSCPTSASFLSFAFGLQPLRPFQNFVLDFCFHFPEIPIISAVVSVFGKSLRKVGVIFHTPPPVKVPLLTTLKILSCFAATVENSDFTQNQVVSVNGIFQQLSSVGILTGRIVKRVWYRKSHKIRIDKSVGKMPVLAPAFR